MSTTTLSPRAAAQRGEIVPGLVAAGLISALAVVCLSQYADEGGASSGSDGVIAQWLIGVGCIAVTFVIGLLLLGARRERQQRRCLEEILQERTAALRVQTEKAAALTRDLEEARAEVQRFNDFLEPGRFQERSSDLRSATTGPREALWRSEADNSPPKNRSEPALARHEIERSLAEHTQELVRSNHELEQFAYVASHDLQEPLRAISGCVEILELRYAPHLDARAHELIAHTVAGVGRMRQLIEDLLEYSRVRLGGTVSPVSVEAALQTALQQLESAIEKTGAVIEYGEMPTVCADPSQLVQLLQNLLGNAIKYRGPAAPLVKISALRSEQMWIIAVRDNGIGIEPQYFERIFAIFQRLHTRDEYPGTGIGLALCRRIVDQAGGSIWIESELGKGSTFYFTLPALTKPDASPGGQVHASASGDDQANPVE